METDDDRSYYPFFRVIAEIEQLSLLKEISIIKNKMEGLFDYLRENVEKSMYPELLFKRLEHVLRLIDGDFDFYSKKSSVRYGG